MERQRGSCILLFAMIAGGSSAYASGPPDDVQLLPGAVFTRDSLAYYPNKNQMVGYPANAPRTSIALSCSTSDGRILTNEVPGGVLWTWCSNAAGLYGILSSNTSRLYRSSDGLTGWQLIHTATDATFMSMFTLRDGRLIAFCKAGAVYYPRYSDDNGSTWNPCANTAGGSAVFTKCAYYWNLHQAPHGTIVASTYGPDTGVPNQIWRSVDNGATWTKVLEVASPTFIHFHAVGFHVGRQLWLQDTGDGTGKQFTYVSADDGCTWDHYMRSSDGSPLPSNTGQVTRFRDFGDPTRLLVGSDDYLRVGFIDTLNWSMGTVLEPAIRTPYSTSEFFFDVFQCDGLWYACNSSDGPAGTRAVVICVSPDLENWVIYHRFESGTVNGCVQFAGMIGGKMHLLVRDNGAWGHFAISPAQVSLRPALMLAPQKANAMWVGASSCDTTTGWSAWTGGEFLVDTQTKLEGTGSLCYRRNGGSNDLFLRSPASPVTPGQTYIAHAWVRGNGRYADINIDGGSLSRYGLKPDQWTEIWTTPFQIPANVQTRTIDIRMMPNMYPSSVSFWVDAVELVKTPFAPWVPGGPPEKPEVLRTAIDISANFTHAMIVRVLPSTLEMGLSPLVIRSYDLDASERVDLLYDPSDYRFKLRSSKDGITQSMLASKPRWLQRGALVKLVVRRDAGLHLSISDGIPVEHVADTLQDSVVDHMPGRGRFISSGDKADITILPHLVIGETLYRGRSLSDAVVDHLLAPADLCRAELDLDSDGDVDEVDAQLVLGDVDADGDVDLTDLQAFISCANGPEVPYAADCTLPRDSQGKVMVDFDRDGDLDQDDFGVLQRLLMLAQP